MAAFDPDAYLAEKATDAFDPDAYLAEGIAPAISREEADSLYREIAGQPMPEGFAPIVRRIPEAPPPREATGTAFNPATGEYEDTYESDRVDPYAAGPVRDTVQRLKRGAVSGAGRIVQGFGRVVDTIPDAVAFTFPGIGAAKTLQGHGRFQDFGSAVEEAGLETPGIDASRNQTLLAQGVDMFAPLVPIIASGPAAFATGGLLMGEEGARAAEARGEDAAGVRRSALLNTLGGAALNAVPFLGVARGAPVAQRAIQGFNSGVLVNTAGDALLQLADTGEITADRGLANALIGGAAGGTIGASMRGARAQAPRARGTNETLPALDLDAARNQYNQAIELETADALRRNLELQDQRLIDAQLDAQAMDRRAAQSAAGGEALRTRLSPEEYAARPRGDIETQVVDSPEIRAIDQNTNSASGLSAADSASAFLAAEDQARLLREAASVDAEMASTLPEEIQLSPQAQRAADEFEGQFSGSRSRQFRNRQQGSIDPTVARTLGGGAAGAAYGYATGDTPEERAARAAAFGVGGAVLGGATPAIGRALSRGGSSSRRTTGIELDAAGPAPLGLRAQFPEVYSSMRPNDAPVLIRAADGQEYPASLGGYYDMGNGDFMEIVGRPTPDGWSRGTLLPGETIVSPVPTPQQWAQGVREIADVDSPIALEPPGQALEVEPIGMQELVLQGVGEPEMQYQVRRPGEEGRGVTMTASQLSEQGIPIPDAANSGRSLATGSPFDGPNTLQQAVDGTNPFSNLEPTEVPGFSFTPKPSNAPLPRNTRVPRTLKEAGLDSAGLQLKTKLFDYTAPEETLARNFEMEFGYEVPPSQKLSYLNSRVINSRSIADAFLESSGYKQLIRDIPDLAAWDQHLIDLHSLDIARNEGITNGKTIDGIDVEQAQARVNANRERFAPYVERLRPFADDILGRSVQYGLISAEKASVLNDMYPNYVPMEKVFDEAEKAGLNMNTGNRTAVASLSKQSVIRKRDGTASTREIASPTASFLNKVDALFLQGAKNDAAKALAESRRLPGFYDILEEVDNDNNAPHTFSYLDNGVKRTIAGPKEVVEAVKSLNRQQLGLLGRAVGYIMRTFKIGVTGADPIFALRNTVRDQGAGALASSDPIAFAANFPRGVAEAVGHGKIYQRLLAEGGVNTSFDIARNNPQASVNRIRAGRSVGDKALYTAKNPSEFVRAVEDTIGRSEQATRIQTYITEYENALKQGYTPKDASALGAEAARQHLADFSRHGDYGPIMRAFQPYLTAAFAGNRALLRNFRKDPVRATARTATWLGMPVLAATTWALIDPKRREAWNDIPDYEKDNNLIFVPDNPVKDENGRWNVTKVPLPQGYSNMAATMRMAYERWHGNDPASFVDMAQKGLGMVSPIEPSAQGVASNALAQPVKPIVEIMLNKNSFTGREIVPDNLQRLDPERQHNKRTSGTAIQIGKAIGVSPLYVEHAIKGYTGTLGAYGMNAADRAQRAAGNEDIQVGGRSVADQFGRAFKSAQGGETGRRFYETVQKSNRARATYMSYLSEGREAEAEAYYQQNAALIDAARSLERTARRNRIDPSLEGDDLREAQRERDLRMREALIDFEDRQAEGGAR